MCDITYSGMSGEQVTMHPFSIMSKLSSEFGYSNQWPLPTSSMVFGLLFLSHAVWCETLQQHIMLPTHLL